MIRVQNMSREEPRHACEYVLTVKFDFMCQHNVFASVLYDLFITVSLGEK